MTTLVAASADAVALMTIPVRALRVRLATVLAAVRAMREVHTYVVHRIAQLSKHFAAEFAGETLALSGAVPIRLCVALLICCWTAVGGDFA